MHNHYARVKLLSDNIALLRNLSDQYGENWGEINIFCQALNHVPSVQILWKAEAGSKREEGMRPNDLLFR